MGNNLFGFFQQTFTIPFSNLPQWMDDREALRRHIFALDGELFINPRLGPRVKRSWAHRGAATAGEMKGIKDQLLLAHNAVEATKVLQNKLPRPPLLRACRLSRLRARLPLSLLSHSRFPLPSTPLPPAGRARQERCGDDEALEAAPAGGGKTQRGPGAGPPQTKGVFSPAFRRQGRSVGIGAASSRVFNRVSARVRRRS